MQGYGLMDIFVAALKFKRMTHGVWRTTVLTACLEYSTYSFMISKQYCYNENESYRTRMRRGILQPLTKYSTVSVLCHVRLGCAGWICDEKCVRKEKALIIFTDNSITHSENCEHSLHKLCWVDIGGGGGGGRMSWFSSSLIWLGFEYSITGLDSRLLCLTSAECTHIHICNWAIPTLCPRHLWWSQFLLLGEILESSFKTLLETWPKCW